MSAEYLVISASLRPSSHSHLMAEFLAKELEGDHLDLREFPLPMCDGDAAYDDPKVPELRARVEAARVILLAVPIYNFYANAAAKNLVELTGGAWEDKIVGFACAAGGQSSYMSIMSLANSLMLDFRCIILPRFVYATGDDFEDGKITSDEVKRRLSELAESARLLRVGK
jgi:FMN reductase